MSPVARLDLIVLAAGLLVALALVAFGVLRAANAAKALKARVEGYAELPVLVYVDRTTRKIDAASRAIARAPGMVDRARVAQRDIAGAFANVRAILTTPTSIWRLGEWFVTGE